MKELKDIKYFEEEDKVIELSKSNSSNSITQSEEIVIDYKNIAV